MDKYIGLDMDCKKTVGYTIVPGQSESSATFGPDIESIRRYFRQERKGGYQLHAAFEISGQAGFLYDALLDEVDSLHVANPTKMTWIYRYMPSREVRQWRQTILHRQKVVQKVGQVKNRLRAALKSEGYGKPAHRGSWWKHANRVWMEQLCDDCVDIGSLWRLQVQNLLDELSLLETQRDRITKYLDGYLDKQSAAKLLMSIPGVGPRTAEAVLAYTDGIERFSNYKKYCAYFGVTPKLDESGSFRRLGHISKQGPAVVRWLLCESGWKVVRHCPGLRAFYERVMAGQQSRKKIAIIALTRKLLCIMRAMLMTGELFNEKLVIELLKAA
ncbi:MAG: IS110 family RNA-guided transposase [Planctomycetota bacterium]|jgi:transposase